MGPNQPTEVAKYDAGETAQEFVVCVGNHPVFSSKSEELCKEVAKQKALESIRQGNDPTNAEFEVKVGQVFSVNDNPRGAGTIRF